MELPLEIWSNIVKYNNQNNTLKWFFYNLTKSSDNIVNIIIINNCIYNGELKNQIPNGQGKLYYQSGQMRYEGEYKDGKFNGQGKCYCQNGQLNYEGEYKDGKPNEQEKYYNNDQTKYNKIQKFLKLFKIW